MTSEKQQENSYRVTKYWYEKDGAKYPRGTAVIKLSLHSPELEAWRLAVGFNVSEAIKNKAAKRGTAVHKLMEKISLGKSPRVPKAYVGHIEQYRKYLEKHEPNFIHPEATLFSEEFGFATTMDAIAEIGGEIGVVEYKTSKGIYPSHIYQAAAEFILAKENGFDPQFAQIVIVRPDKFDTLMLSEKELQAYIPRFLVMLDHFKEFVLPDLPDEEQDH